MDTEQFDDEKPEFAEKPPASVGIFVFAFLIIILVLVGLSIRNLLIDEQKLPIQKIVFTGELNILDAVTLERNIRAQFQQSFFLLDVNQVHEALMDDPWVYRVSIRKRWPNALLIHIIEQHPVAFWNEKAFINKYGETFVGEVTKNNPLPRLYGPAGSEKTALDGYQAMQTLLTASQQNIVDLYLSERFSWQVRLNNNVLLKLGRQEYVDRLQRFIDYYPFISARDKAVSYIDLRYDTGMAVGWMEQVSTLEAATEEI